jgi:uncharacterized protein YbjT (DUF2867 family)
MILITGGTGTSGGQVVQQLRATGKPFRILARDPAKAEGLKGPGVEVVAGDLAKPGSLAAALAGVEKVFLLSPPAPDQVEVETNLVNAAKNAGVKHIVKFSAMTADAKAPPRFPRAHGQIEDVIKASGLAWTFLRPPFFMQNLLGLAGMVREGTIYQPAKKSRAAFVDTKDIAAVAVQALIGTGHEGKAYEITGPDLVNYDEVAALFTKVIGHQVLYQDVPPAIAKQAMLAMGIPEWNVDGILELMDQMRAGKYEKISNVVREVGQKRPTKLEQFIRDNVAAFAAPSE